MHSTANSAHACTLTLTAHSLAQLLTNRTPIDLWAAKACRMQFSCRYWSVINLKKKKKKNV